jgi:hypothetical protein
VHVFSRDGDERYCIRKAVASGRAGISLVHCEGNRASEDAYTTRSTIYGWPVGDSEGQTSIKRKRGKCLFFHIEGTREVRCGNAEQSVVQVANLHWNL